MSVLMLVLKDTMLIVQFANLADQTVLFALTHKAVLLVSQITFYSRQAIHLSAFKIAQ
jgi:hypothetical protein